MDAPFDCFTVNIFQKELISFLRHRGVMTICAFRYSGTKSGGKWTVPTYQFVSNLQEIEKCYFKREQGKGTKLTVPQPTVFCFTGKTQHHEAHTHPHQTALFPSAH